MREFTTTGSCVPSEHYMVDISGKLVIIKELVNKRKYFTINRARQYGKTTTLNLLANELRKEYVCISMSFENTGYAMFESTKGFCQRFLWQIEMEMEHFNKEEAGLWKNESIIDFDLLGQHLTKLCTNKKVVLIIDEVDRAASMDMGNYKLFISFLSMLRDKYLDRNRGVGATFHSVILAGVTDVKNLKSKMVASGTYKLSMGEGLSSSPWNIAANFKVDLSFKPDEIATMLKQYEEEHLIGVDISSISEEIYGYTAGYPFLVSRICQIIEEELNRDWTIKGVQEAVKSILEEKNTLFDDMSKNLENHNDLREFVRMVLIDGAAVSFSTDDVCIDFGMMYGYFKNDNSRVAISNRIFEIRLSNYFILRDRRDTKQITGVVCEDVIRNGRFDMELCIIKFAEHYHELFADRDAEFLERHGRLLFLSYLKPLINGVGFYHIESETSNVKRMDIVVDYGRDQFIIELKRWYGESAHKQAYEQLLGYMESRGLTEGYLLTFDFSRKIKHNGYQWVAYLGKKIFDVVV